ncbi:MAG: LacI family transcriptional regulator [Chloroflexi bacterium]|nr:MAG: LacI family transcriptional regulator [Chloroflexota bacterium]
MATIRDVAKAANVSISTVSHVINGTRYVSPDTEMRVMNAIEKLHYQHNRLASSLRNRKTHTIGVLVPNCANPYFAELLEGIESICYENDYHIIMGNAHDDSEREQAYVDVLISRQVDGILLISTGAYDQSLQQIHASNTPVVIVDRSANLAGVDEISTDNRMGGRIATEYLIGLGHRRIGCVAGLPMLTLSTDRLQGYYDAFHAHQLTPKEAWIVRGDFQYQSGYDAAKQLMQLDEKPTAIFACNDLMAVGVMAALSALNFHVPDDVSVIGYDDVPLASFVNPRLTTIAQPARDIGKLAVKRLLERIETSDSPVQQTMLPVKLIERDSCAPLQM